MYLHGNGGTASFELKSHEGWGAVRKNKAKFPSHWWQGRARRASGVASSGQVSAGEQGAGAESRHRPHSFLLPSRFHPAVAHLLQRCPLLLCLLLPFPHLWHPHHHHSAGALQKPELQQELRGEEWGAPVVDQGAAPQLLPDLPGASCAQHPPRSHRLRRLRSPPADVAHGRVGSGEPCGLFLVASCSVIGQATAPNSAVSLQEPIRPGTCWKLPVTEMTASRRWSWLAIHTQVS